MESKSSPLKNNFPPAWFNSFAVVRSDGYVVLASLLRSAPNKDTIDILKNLQWEEALSGKLEQAFINLQQACRDCCLAAVQNEYNRLFEGLGCGELLPYKSWYQERRIQSAPLAFLRADLMNLGIIRQTDCLEPEDHAGVLCEIMAIITQRQSGIDYTGQAFFFKRHILPWLMHCFKDIERAGSAYFYRFVGFFGRHFLETENEFLSSRQMFTPKRKEIDK